MSFLEKIRSNALGGLRPYGASVLQSTLLTLAAVAVSTVAAFICAKAVTPAWTAPGWPSYYQYAKNVESKALALALLSVLVVSLILSRVRSTAVRAAISILLAVVALICVYRYLHIEAPVSWINPVLTLFILLGLVYYFMDRELSTEWTLQTEAGTSGLARLSVKYSIFIVAGALGVGYSFLSKLALLFPRKLDLHHHGERFTSALDFADGGIPFVTYFWPHGLHDTGITTLAFKLFGTADFPTLLIADAFSLSFDTVTVLLLALGMGLGYYSILVMASLLLFNYTLDPGPFSQLLFVIPAFLLYAKGKRWFCFVLSGFVLFVAHLYRIEAGIYGAMAIAGLGCLQLFASAVSKDFTAVKLRARNLALFVVAIFASMGAAYVLLGWPGPEWYKVIFGTLPKFMADSTGFPFPLPLDSENYRLGLKGVRFATVYYTAVVGLLALTTVFVVRRLKDLKESDYFFVLLVLLSVVSLRTAFGRSDFMHIHQYSNFIYLLLLLYISRGVVRAGLGPKRKVAIVALLFIFCNFWTGSFNNTPHIRHDKVLTESSNIFADYKSPRPAQCSSGIFSAKQLKMRQYRAYDNSVCGTKEILDIFEIKSGELLVTHSASLIYPSLGLKPPTGYYCLGWAITPEMQRGLIAELEASNVKVILTSKKYGEYDIPDRVRLPIYHKWLQENFDLSTPIITPLGTLVFAKSMGIDFSKPFYTPQGYMYLQ
ncbi:MAG: hypothetical protein IME99_00385 [Proteobacteria bacterium]|nr:hypothetical protein [Pseudomonadota bacterium]